jgi:hypothetical protein
LFLKSNLNVVTADSDTETSEQPRETATRQTEVAQAEALQIQSSTTAVTQTQASSNRVTQVRPTTSSAIENVNDQFEDRNQEQMLVDENSREPAVEQTNTDATQNQQ